MFCKKIILFILCINIQWMHDKKKYIRIQIYDTIYYDLQYMTQYIMIYNIWHNILWFTIIWHKILWFTMGMED
jgi:hypothetical protein